MMIGVLPAELALIVGDFVDLFNSPEATDCIMTWVTNAEPYPVGNWVGPAVTHTQAFRGIIVFALGVGRMKPVATLSRQRFAEMPQADIAIMLPASIDLKGKVNLVFTITGLGDYRVVEQPAEGLNQYSVMFPNGNGLVQYVEMKGVK
jgi:hypothetical protein